MSAATDAAWQRLADGNERFRQGGAEHPRQDAARRSAVAEGQAPFAAILGCSDSRVGPETVFDAGLGDLFVVRNAGQVADPSAVASLEYAIAVLGTQLVVVLAHDRCGAVRAAIDVEGPDAPTLPPRIAAHVAAIRPAVRAASSTDARVVGRVHLESTVASLLEASLLITGAVADGTVDVIGAEYLLAEGRVARRFGVGDPR